MAGLFYNLGRKLGPKVRKGKWMWQSMTGTENDAIAAENAVGNDLAAEVIKQVGNDSFKEGKEFLDSIGARLSACVNDKKRNFQYGIISEKDANAFALPGGYVFVTRRMLDLCKWDVDEVAFILAHEMGHIVKKHAIGRIMADSAITFASRMSPARGAVGGWLKRVGIKYVEAAYSQDRELAADEFAISLVKAAGFDELGGEKLFKRLAFEYKGKDPKGIAKYFATHPEFAERIYYLRKHGK